MRVSLTENQNAQLIYLEYWENQMMAKKIAQMLDAGYDARFAPSRFVILEAKDMLNADTLRELYAYIPNTVQYMHVAPHAKKGADDYMQIKLPDKFMYHVYFSNTTHIYDKDRRQKRRQLSLVLYNLYREGVDFSSHFEKIDRIFSGKTVSVDKPFFVSTRELSYVHPRLKCICCALRRMCHLFPIF